MKKFIPHKYQEPIMTEIKSNDFFGCFAFPGSGKTAIALDAIYHYREFTLIIVPLEILYTTWMNEPKKWEFSQNLKYHIIHGKDKDKNFFKKGGVHLINPDGLNWFVKKIKATRHFPWQNLIVDESVKFKNFKSVRFKCLKSVLKTFKRRYVLCGNPMPKDYLDLWAQVYILDQGKRLGSSWYQYRNKYFYPTDYMRYNWVLKPNAKEEIVEAIGDIAMFLDVSDELQLPTPIVNNISILLPPEAMKKYKKMEHELFVEIDSGENVLASTKSAALIKCWQIANGFLYESADIDGKRVRVATHYIHNELINQTKVLVEELQGQPILIAYHFAEDLERLKKEFPNARVACSGMKPKEIKQIEKDWNEDKIEILLAYISKFSHGLNLQHGSGHHILFYCLTYNYDTYDQLIKRFERQGAKYSTVVVHRLVVQDTIHEAIIANLATKKNESEDFLLALKHYREERL